MNKDKKAFTLVELVITISIIVILSLIAGPMYKDYARSSKFSEGYLLLSAIKDAQRIYRDRYGTFYVGTITNYDPVLQIDARTNKYFRSFCVNPINRWDGYFAYAIIPENLRKPNKYVSRLCYYLTGTGGNFIEKT